MKTTSSILVVVGLLSLCQGNRVKRWNEEGEMTGVHGQPGIDYPNYKEVPETSFSCKDQLYTGLYADVETQCQAYHVCYSENRVANFLCASGTVFNQKILTCDYWYNVECEESPNYYYLNGQTEDVSQQLHTGSQPQQQTGYQPQQQTGYQPQRQTGHQPQQQTGYQPQQQTGYQPQQQTGYQPQQQTDYQPQQQTGYQPQQTDYQPQQKIDYQPHQQTGYQPESSSQQQTGYQPQQQTGYQPQQQTDYQPQQQTGYQPEPSSQQQTGYQPQPESRPQQQTGYQQTGYQPLSGSQPQRQSPYGFNQAESVQTSFRPNPWMFPGGMMMMGGPGDR
ncbi:uncharacterized protein LOC143255992 isoform X2 [Tachypleus tridentatus]|uniref:uncharacterized protein LOC143255992 isoform X2 n=1 Tax=Tachypleus tridentatus TaxID=6853 RepID=UPI003FD23313